VWIGRNRKARVTYGFDEIALVPGRVTINPNEVETTFRLPRNTPRPWNLKSRSWPARWTEWSMFVSLWP